MSHSKQHPRLREAILLLTFFALLLASLPASADGIQLRPEIPTFKANSPEEFEAHVRATYALIEQYSQNAEQPVEFELSDFDAVKLIDTRMMQGRIRRAMRLKLYGILRRIHHELVPFRESGIQAIDLDYFLSGRSDRHGNLLHWASMVDFEQGRRLGAMDVIFVTPGEP